MRGRGFARDGATSMEIHVIHHSQLLKSPNREHFQRVVAISASGFLLGDHLDVAFSRKRTMKVNQEQNRAFARNFGRKSKNVLLRLRQAKP